MKKPRTDSLEYIAQKHKQEQEEYLKVGIVKRVALYARQSVDKKDSISIETQLDACRYKVSSIFVQKILYNNVQLL